MATSTSTSNSDRKSRNQTFKEEYKKTWDFIKPSRKGNNHAYCSICSTDFSIAASGKYDINKHIRTAKHRSSAECKETNRPITQFLSPLSTNYDVIRAETLWTLYVVENNMPFVSSDGFCDVVKSMFMDIIENGQKEHFNGYYGKYMFTQLNKRKKRLHVLSN